jgi:hypothetical protein
MKIKSMFGIGPSLHPKRTWAERHKTDANRSSNAAILSLATEGVEGPRKSHGGYFAGHPRAEVYVDKILRGTKPADIPVEQPTKFDLVINRKAAKVFGLSIS